MNDGHFFEAELFGRVAVGDEAAFRGLFELFAPRLQAMAARITGSVAVADDLVQDTFLKLWLHRDQLADLQHPGAWVKKICFFLSVNYMRRQSIRGKVMDAVEYQAALSAKGLSAGEQADFHQLLDLLGAAVQRLPEKQRRVYRLSREQGLNAAEIAQQMNLATSTVKNLLVMALKDIRASLQQAGYPLLLLLLIDLFA